jgi:hypothetical protein
MPILNKPLNPNGHAIVDLILLPSQPRRTALQAAGQSHPPQNILAGVLDTGAAFTVIDPQVRRALNLAPSRIRRAAVPNTAAPIRVPSYKLDLAIMDPFGQFWLLCPMLSVLEMPLSHTGVSVLVGCDVLFKCHFIHNGSAGAFTLAY